MNVRCTQYYVDGKSHVTQCDCQMLILFEMKVHDVRYVTERKLRFYGNTDSKVSKHVILCLSDDICSECYVIT